MAIGMRMTIQDYFRQSKLLRRQSVALKGTVAKQFNGTTKFSRVLSAAQSSAEAKGWTIRDYMQRPMQLTRTVPASPAGRMPRPVQPSLSKGREITTAPEEAIEHIKKSEADKVGENRQIQASIRDASVQYDLPPALIEAVIKAESNYNVLAVSPAGAQGLMQLMPATASELGVDNPFDINQNVQGGARYLRQMLDRYKGDIKLALSAYNAGPGTVAKFNGHVPYPETQNYLRRVMKYAQQLSAAGRAAS